MKNKEKYYLIKVEKIALKIIKLGEKLDKMDIPFQINYENRTHMINKNEK